MNLHATTVGANFGLIVKLARDLKMVVQLGFQNVY